MTWRRASTHTRAYLHGIWGDARHLVVTGAGSVLRCATLAEGTLRWRKFAVPFTDTFDAVWGDEGGNVYVLGHAQLLHADLRRPLRFASHPHKLGGRAQSLVGDRRGHLHAGGASLWRSDDRGVTWREHAGVPSGDYHSLLALEDGRLLALSATGTLLRSDEGTRWSKLATRLGTGTNGMSGTAGWLFLVGNGGLIRHSSDGGAHWSPCDSGSKQDLHAIWSDGGGTVLAVGAKGTLLVSRDGGAHFSDETQPRYHSYMMGAWGTPDGALIAIGDDGLLLRRSK